MNIPFEHRQSAHCESGVTANLLRHYGHPVSEALAFGIGSGYFFGYFSFVKINKLPLITFRSAAGSIFRKCAKRVGMQVGSCRFRSQERAMSQLDQQLEQGIPTGLQTGVYWLPYFPPALRFHFNAHNLVVFAKEGDEYLISDPVFDTTVRCSSADLCRARFAKGALAPKGRMYYVTKVAEELALEQAVRQGIKETASRMVKVPVSLIGVRGIRLLAKDLQRWPTKLGRKRAIQYLGHTIRMQEEIGTGGGGFRFIYAAFLQEAAEILGQEELKTCADEMTQIGDLWRQFALEAGRICKGRAADGGDFNHLADLLRDCADREEQIFKRLLQLVG